MWTGTLGWLVDCRDRQQHRNWKGIKKKTKSVCTMYICNTRRWNGGKSRIECKIVWYPFYSSYFGFHRLETKRQTKNDRTETDRMVCVCASVYTFIQSLIIFCKLDWVVWVCLSFLYLDFEMTSMLLSLTRARVLTVHRTIVIVIVSCAEHMCVLLSCACMRMSIHNANNRSFFLPRTVSPALV